MDEQGLWRLFFATGSPLVWLAIRRLEREEEQQAVPAAPPILKEFEQV